MTATNGDPENGTVAGTRQASTKSDYHMKTFQGALNLLTHILIGIVLGVALVFAFRNGLPLNATNCHIVLCVTGYQFLMAQACLSLSPHNGWSAHLKLVDKRRAHWVLQILGSVLAIAGSFIKILDKTVHWNTLHGQFALVALILTVICLVNGLTSLYAYEFRKFIPGKLSKLTHICFGIVAFAASTISLCFGFEKTFFMMWIGEGMGYALITFAAAFTFIIIVQPAITFVSKIKSN